MIVMLNSFDLPIVPFIAKALIARYEAGAGVDVHEIVARLGLFQTSEIPVESVLAEIHELVSLEKQHGVQDVVVNYGFENPSALKQFRVFLSQYDSEIYAFRLRFSDAVLTEFRSAGILSASYINWLQNQEEGSRCGDMGYEIIVNAPEPIETANAIWEDVHEPIELTEYQANWPDMFAHEKTQMLHKLQGLVIDIEHIGSTAIPNMIAKPVIDILLTVKHLQDAPKCIQPLRELGYAFIDYPQNTDRLFFRKGKPRQYHLHIVAKGSLSELNHIHFRDALLSDNALREEYLRLKQVAIQQHKYRRALYGECKTEFIKRALAKFRKSSVTRNNTN
jgi:GrpB-like predicted nucleotidyltransferase (UPF0157 family)